MGGGETWDAAIPEKDMLIRPGNKLLHYGGGVRTISPRGSATLASTILALNPICYWKMDELSGTTMINYGTLGSAANGTYTGVTLNQIDAPGGGRAGLWDGLNDYGNYYSAALAAAFSGAAGSLHICLKQYNTSTAQMVPVCFGANSSNRMFLWHDYVKRIQVTYVAGGVTEQYDNLTATVTNWNYIVVTWNKAAEQVIYYLNGVPVETDTTLGIWAGTLASTMCIIGAYDMTVAYPYYGYLAHAVICNYAATPEQIAGVYAAGI